MNDILARLDPAHSTHDVFDLEMSKNLFADKYQWGDEDFRRACWRVAQAVNGEDGQKHAEEGHYFMEAGLWMPAGRVWAGAGTPKIVTMINCFVNENMEDSMVGIMRGLSNTAFSMQMGGGMGTPFHTLRPAGAILKRTHTRASGPLPFMDMFNGMSRTVRSAGDRRGAMMGTITDTHPDMPLFVVAKRMKDRLTEFNMSIAISEAFMDAVAEDEEWLLYFHIPPFRRDPSLVEHDFVDEFNVQQYVYSVHRARDLWRLITENTYEYSEPGIIFMDRVNELNNLQHVEDIWCTNPCGEQPLPPHGCCDLGHANVSRMVKRPFTDNAEFDWPLLRETVKVGHRFLDNVLDVTHWPLPEQKVESDFKRRIGLGHTGLADAMAMLKMRYGSARSVDFAEAVSREICLASYETNIELAIEKGPCTAASPDYIDEAEPIERFSAESNAEKIVSGTRFAAVRLPEDMKKRIREHGLRNGVALTVAPTGTVSATFWNLAGSGCEPIFAHEYDRKVRVTSDSGDLDEYKTYHNVRGYANRVWKKMHGESADYPSWMVTAQSLEVQDHVAVQAAVQRWVDASVSKTVNVPKEMSYDEFVKVYDLAYQLGCKGCTTFRPSPVRGSILSVADEDAQTKATAPSQKRPHILNGCTYQIKWPRRKAALYLTLNHDDNGLPSEILVSSKDSSSFEWVTALTLMITAIFKKGGDVSFVADELKQVQSVSDACWVNGKWYGSLVAFIGHVLEGHFNGGSEEEKSPPTVGETSSSPMGALPVGTITGEVCPDCNAPAVVPESGCKKCRNCGWNSCD